MCCACSRVVRADFQPSPATQVTGYIVMAYTVMAYVVVAHAVMAYILMACILMACVVMARIVMAYAGMAAWRWGFFYCTLTMAPPRATLAARSLADSAAHTRISPSRPGP